MTAGRVAFEGFSLVVPDGWSEVLEDATFSDPDHVPPVALAAKGGAGTLYVAAPLVEESLDLSATVDVAEWLVRDWSKRRGLPTPVETGSELAGGVARATAVHRVGEDFVQAWSITDGRWVVEVSYVCRWDARDQEHAEREAMVASLCLG